jgi:hypothetical protein
MRLRILSAAMLMVASSCGVALAAAEAPAAGQPMKSTVSKPSALARAPM